METLSRSVLLNLPNAATFYYSSLGCADPNHKIILIATS